MEWEIEKVIYEAWEKIEPRLRDDPDELAARRARRRMGIMRRAPRAWCLAVRANDTRMTAMNTVMMPDRPVVWDRENGRLIYREHTVKLEAGLLRWLCRPVPIPAPGVEAKELAEMLGVNNATVNRAMRRGVFESVMYYRGLGGNRGHLAPVVHKKGLLDPAGVPMGRMADGIWGNTWRWVSDHVPDGLEQTLVRRAHFRKVKGKRGVVDEAEMADGMRMAGDEGPLTPTLSPEYRGEGAEDQAEWLRRTLTDAYRRLEHQRREEGIAGNGDGCVFRGWRWVCPGCGREVTHIYCPLPPMELAGFVRGEDDGSADALGKPPGCFACRKCHGVLQDYPLMNGQGWNQFVSHVTGGLLYGREVRRPPGLTMVRKRTCRVRRDRGSSKRGKQIRGFLVDTELSCAQIALRLGLRPGTVQGWVGRIYARSGVHSREELRRKLAGEAGSMAKAAG